MSFLEIKEQVAGLSAEERLELAALIAHLARTDDPQYQASLDRKLADLASGKAVSESDLKRIHREQTASGH